MTRGLLWAIPLVLCSLSARAADPVELELWPDEVPGQAADEERVIVVKPDDRIGGRITKVTKPMLTVYKPAKEKDTGAAVVVCPGGGYNILAHVHEGKEVADWLNSIGVTAIVLYYRVPRAKGRPKHELPLMDAQRALSLARHHAKEWEIDLERIGMLGFSAGGHLTAACGTNFDKRAYEKVDEADKLSCRPDFLLLIYPAYLVEKGSTQLNEEIRITDETPPTFLVHTHDDRVTSESSIGFYLGLKARKIPSELHVFPSGGHGYGLRKSKHAVTGWPKLATRWLKSMEIIKEN